MTAIPDVSKITIGCDDSSDGISARRGILLAAYFPSRVPDEVLEFLVRE